MHGSPSPRRLTRRSVLSVMGFGACSALLAACSPAVPTVAPTAAPTATAPPPSPTATVLAPAAPASAAPRPTVTATVQARSGGTLRISRTVDIVRPDGHALGGYQTIVQAYDTLTRYDDKVQPVPLLAERWEASSDARQWKLSLRKGVQFHSGRELTAEDVKFSILRVRDVKVGATQLKTLSEWISEIETPDKHTVTLKLTEVRPLFDFFNYLAIVDKDTVDNQNAPQKAVGTGPFVFTEWVAGDHLRFVKNKNYWQSGRPYLDEVIYRVIRDPQAISAQLEAGASDVAEGVPLSDVARLGKDPRFQLPAYANITAATAILANVISPPLDNKKVRQAIAYAIDRQRFAQTVLAGQGELSPLPWPSGSPAYEPAKQGAYAYNLDKARALLDESGVRNSELPITYNASDKQIADLAQILQTDLNKIGMKARLDPQEATRASELFFGASYEGLFVGGYGFSNLEPTMLFVTSFATNYKKNSSNFTSADYTRLVETALAEPDPAKRKGIYSRINDLLLDECFLMGVGRPSVGPVASTKVRAHYLLTAALALDEAWLGS